MKIALAGNPNCGKTTMFNALTGANQYVGNWPGVTVEYKEGKTKADKDLIVTDLPGIYSLSPYTNEEIVSRDYLRSDEASAVIDIVDATNIERNLYLTTQILELGKPVVVALNMVDALKKSGDKIDTAKLSEKLGCKVIETVALHNKGVKEVTLAAAEEAKKGTSVPKACFAKDVEDSISRIAALLPSEVKENLKRWTAIKVLEKDEKVIADIKLSDDSKAKALEITKALETAKDDDIESIITNERYNYIINLLKGVVVKSGKKLTTSDKIDRIVTNRWLGIPIFLLVMGFVYWISVSTVGTWMTDWTNDTLVAGATDTVTSCEDYASFHKPEKALPDGVDLEEFDPEDEEAVKELGLTEDDLATIGEWSDYEDNKHFHRFIAGWYNNSAAKKASEENPVSIGWGIQGLVQAQLENAGANEILTDCIVNGIIGGLGAVLGFVPQMFILFLLLSIVEDCGYMVRIAFVMDRIFRKFGLSGKSFIPLLIGSGCGVPGIMASRTIENENDRRMTIMTTTWVPCGAKLPVIALFAALFAEKLGVGSASWVAPLMYVIGIGSVVIAAVMLKKTKAFHGPAAPFIMELPQYHFPQPKTVLMHAWERTWSFIKKAGTILFVACLVMWFLASYGVEDGKFTLISDSNCCLLAYVGNVLRYLFIPLGWGGANGGWQCVASALSGFSAKEGIVSTLGVLANVSEEALEESGSVATAISQWFPTALAAFSFLMFNLLDSPCLAAISTMANELNNKKWFWFAIAFQNVFAYVMTLIVYQLGMLFVHGAFSVHTVFAFIFLAFILFMLFRPNPYAKKTAKADK